VPYRIRKKEDFIPDFKWIFHSHPHMQDSVHLEMNSDSYHSTTTDDILNIGLHKTDINEWL